MRGKVNHCKHYTPICRITPAYAGKSRGIPRLRQSRKDHPRLCGEKSYLETGFGL